MSYETRHKDDGATIVMPLELPMFDGGTSELGAQASIDMISFLRHHAACDTIENNFDLDDPVIFDLYKQEYAQMVAKYIAVIMALAGCADNLGIDIMQEIWEMPWEV